MAGKVSIGTAWAEAADFIRRERRLLAPVVLGLIALPATISALVMPNVAVGTIPEPGGWVPVTIIALLVSLMAQLAVMRMAMGWDRSVGEALALALRRLGPVVAALLLFGLIYGLVATPLLVIVAFMTGGDEAAATPLTLFVILLALILIPRILPLTALAMEERIGPWALLRRAYALTRGSHLRILGFFIIYLLVSRLLATVVTVTVGSAAAVLIGSPEPMTVSRLVVALALGLVQGGLATVFAAMTGRITRQLLSAPKSGT